MISDHNYNYIKAVQTKVVYYVCVISLLIWRRHSMQLLVYTDISYTNSSVFVAVII